VDQISRLLEQDESGAFTVNERERVSVAGVINRVTMKTTRKEERMAFFTMEDRYGEIECLVFPKVYASYGHAIHPDAAVCVRGTISCRENEDPKILVDNLLLLVDNETYVHVPEQQESSVAKPTATKPVEAKPRGVPDLQDNYVRHLAEKMKRHLGCAVRVTSGVTHANGKHTKGMVEIDFFDNDDLDRIIRMIGVEID
jgi:DNA polymerase III alpha subunit